MKSLSLPVVALVGFAGLGLVDFFGLPSVDHMLKNARTEIRSEDLPSWLDGLPSSSPVAPQTSNAESQRSSDALPRPSAGETTLAQVRTHTPRAMPLEPARSKVSWWVPFLKHFVPKLFLYEYNRSFYAFKASTGQAALTIENFAVNAVENGGDDL